jgi:hypothetical protein
MSKKAMQDTDALQTLRYAYDEDTRAFRFVTTNSEIPVEFTYRVLTYDGSKNITKVDYYVGGKREKTAVFCIADDSGSLNNKYFTLAVPGTSYYVWLNVNAAGVDPTPGGTGIEVALDTDDTAIEVATKIKAKLDDEDRLFVTSQSTSTQLSHGLIIQPCNVGNVTDATVGDSGFSVQIMNQGEDRTLKASKYYTYDGDDDILTEEIVYFTEEEY